MVADLGGFFQWVMLVRSGNRLWFLGRWTSLWFLGRWTKWQEGLGLFCLTFTLLGQITDDCVDSVKKIIQPSQDLFLSVQHRLDQVAFT